MKLKKAKKILKRQIDPDYNKTVLVSELTESIKVVLKELKKRERKKANPRYLYSEYPLLNLSFK